jgi:uncharacterized protein YjbJ (UPF0337 family)
MGDRKQRAKGAAEQAKGQVKKKTGRVTRNRSQEAAGAAESAKGKVKRAAGKVRSEAKKATR